MTRRFRRARLAVDGTLVMPSDATIGHQPIRAHIAVAPGATVRVGHRVRIGHGCGVSCHASITIDDDAVLGPFVQLLDSDLHVAGAADQQAAALAVHIGRGAVVGAWSTLLPGAHIGAGAVVRPCSVVAGHVPAGAVVAGNPARPLPTGLATDAAEATADDIESVVLDVLRATFGGSPQRQSRRDDVAGWTSLGALRVLVALEDALGRPLPEQGVVTATTVAELIAAVGG
jgi:acetyltransferase-like isoleucine patch superfamily enzyme/acyl carrier protein